MLKGPAVRVVFVGALASAVGCRRSDADPPADEGLSVVGIALLPGSPSIYADSDIAFVAWEILEDGSSRDVTAELDWSMSDLRMGWAESGGVFTLDGAGSVIVEAERPDSDWSARAKLSATWEEASPRDLYATPEVLALRVGEEVPVDVWIKHRDDTHWNIPTECRWSSDAPDIARTSPVGSVRGVAPGQVDVTARFGNLETVIPVTVLDVAPGIPDLVVDTVRATSGGVFVRYTVTVRNDGVGNAGPFDVVVEHGDAAVDPFEAARRAETWVAGLAAGVATTVELDLDTDGHAGSLTHEVSLDSHDLVKEVAEDNNAAAPGLVDLSGGLPDIAVSAFYKDVSKHDSMFWARLENHGGATAHHFWVDLYQGSGPSPEPCQHDYDALPVEALAAGETRSVWFYSTNYDPDQAAWLQVDTCDRVVEANEDNNLAHIEGR